MKLKIKRKPILWSVMLAVVITGLVISFLSIRNALDLQYKELSDFSIECRYIKNDSGSIYLRDYNNGVVYSTLGKIRNCREVVSNTYSQAYFLYAPQNHNYIHELKLDDKTVRSLSETKFNSIYSILFIWIAFGCIMWVLGLDIEKRLDKKQSKEQ